MTEGGRMLTPLDQLTHDEARVVDAGNDTEKIIAERCDEAQSWERREALRRAVIAIRKEHVNT